MLRFVSYVLVSSSFLPITEISARELKERFFEMTYTAEVKDIPKDAKRVEVWIPYPTSDECQTVTEVMVKSPYSTTVNYDSEYGNGILYLLVNNPKVSQFDIQVKFKVLRREVSYNKFDDERVAEFQGDMGPFQKYLRPSKFAIIDSVICRLASEATSDKRTLLEKARAIYNYVLENMDYNKEIPGWGHGDVGRICVALRDGKTGTGNCTDFHSFFGSLMGAIGVPVKFIMGYSLEAGKELPEGKAGGYHCWAKFYLPGYGWIPVDISEADKNPSKKDYFFGSICENRVKFSEGRDILLAPQQQGEKLNYFGPDPYIEVDGIPYGNFERKIAYRNL